MRRPKSKSTSQRQPPPGSRLRKETKNRLALLRPSAGALTLAVGTAPAPLRPSASVRQEHRGYEVSTTYGPSTPRCSCLAVPAEEREPTPRKAEVRGSSQPPTLPNDRQSLESCGRSGCQGGLVYRLTGSWYGRVTLEVSRQPCFKHPPEGASRFT